MFMSCVPVYYFSIKLNPTPSWSTFDAKILFRIKQTLSSQWKLSTEIVFFVFILQCLTRMTVCKMNLFRQTESNMMYISKRKWTKRRKIAKNSEKWENFRYFVKLRRITLPKTVKLKSERFSCYQLSKKTKTR